LFKGIEIGIKLPRILVGPLKGLLKLDPNFGLEVSGILNKGKSKIFKVRLRLFGITLILRY